MKNTMIVAVVIVAVVAGGVGFVGGMKFQQQRVPVNVGRFANGQFGNGQMMRGNNQQFGNQQSGQAVGNGMRGTFRPVNGSIVSVSDNTMTVKLEDGSTKIILFSDTTQLNKAAQATKQDLKVGTTVAVFGQTNADGSVSAQNIQLNPQTVTNISTGSGSANPGASTSPNKQ